MKHNPNYQWHKKEVEKYKKVVKKLRRTGSKSQLREAKSILQYLKAMLEITLKQDGQIHSRKNPPESVVEIYENILAIEAEKGKKSRFPEEQFRHDFKGAKAKILGLPDGSLKIVSTVGKPLWKRFEYP